MTKIIDNLPKCVGFIMDGNRRFAKEQGQSSSEGHLAGKEKLFEVIKWIEEQNIPHAVFYTFSTENWKRDKTEVEHLMNLFTEAVTSFSKQASKENITFKIIGRRTDFSSELLEAVNHLEAISQKANPKLTVWIALSYGGRAEIVAAVNEAVKRGQEVDEKSFAELLWSAGMPDPDLIIRTGGDYRLSNFLPWQSVYSELFFTSAYWPAFTKAEFEGIVSTYLKKDRRIGK
ncbi:MAG TPA: polyprenyl diphosphate synthase [Candidatus Paceibacterota bacterium]|nr:polyprenyl diphosphate synthase [Candidatus Paceibacterota bacterium]HMO82533.1 polyprenyl diphosphate synthase [Candidatus Paceibacterota bacterium]